MKWTKTGCLFEIIYIVLAIVFAVILANLTDSAESFIFWFRLIMSIFALSAILFMARRYVKSKNVEIKYFFFTKTKYFIYTCIFVGEVAIILLISKIFNVDTSNTWLGSVAVIIIFSTLCVLLVSIAKTLITSRTGVAFGLYVIAFFCIIFIIIAVISIFIGYPSGANIGF